MAGAMQSILGRACLKIKNIPMRVLCVLIVGLQAAFLDAILITYYGDGKTLGYCNACYWWIAADVIVIGLFIASFILAYKHIAFLKKIKRLHKDYKSRGIPLSTITWFIYSLTVVGKVVQIFKSDIDDKLEETEFLGPQFLKTAICMSGVVFILYVAGHHHSKETPAERAYIQSLASGVTFDILDTVDFLDIIIVTETGVLITYALENVVISIACINLIRPTFSFLVLFLTHYDATSVSRELSVANILVYLFLVNLPFMVVRMFLWHNLKASVSVFLIKNFIMIFLGVHELFEICMDKISEQDEANPEAIEMYPKATTVAHRPTDKTHSPV